MRLTPFSGSSVGLSRSGSGTPSHFSARLRLLGDTGSGTSVPLAPLPERTFGLGWVSPEPRRRSYWRSIRLVGDTVQITIQGQLVRTHRARHDKSEEFGALAQPNGKPRTTHDGVA